MNGCELQLAIVATEARTTSSQEAQEGVRNTPVQPEPEDACSASLGALRGSKRQRATPDLLAAF
jgi:hypothetical protein